jgi:hypothetical protein
LTTFEFQLPRSGVTTLKIFDPTGKEVATVLNDELNAGSYTTKFNATGLASGLYFFQLKSGALQQTKKMILLQ